MHIVESIDFLDTNGRPYSDKANRFRYLLDYADPRTWCAGCACPPPSWVGPTLRVWGYVPYKSEFTATPTPSTCRSRWSDSDHRRTGRNSTGAWSTSA